MDFFVLPKCKQCNGSLAARADEFFCLSCGMPHPEVKIPDEFEDVEHSALEPFANQIPVPAPTLAELKAAISADPDPETVAHKPAKQKRR